MPECRVCYKELASVAQPCPRCGFVRPAVIGDPNTAEALIARKAEEHQINFLKRFDFGVMIYYWKDQDGTIVLDRKERLSFGIGSDLLNRPLWLAQPFARIPDMQEMHIELSVMDQGTEQLRLPVKLPIPAGSHLQQIGIELMPNMTIQLKLKNAAGQTESAPVLFLREQL